MYIDFHTHILHGIDDGAKDLETALAMTELAYEKGAEKIVLTPHVNATSNFENFLHARQQRYDELFASLQGKTTPHPDFLLGAEVLLDASLAERDDTRSLCIEDTDLLMIELPYVPWNNWYNHEIYNLISKHDVTPVLVHIERYFKSPKDLYKLDALISFGVKFQINASSFLSFKGRRIIRELAATGDIYALASDCHNMTSRSPDISKALSLMGKKFGEEFIDFMYNKTEKLLYDSKIDKN